MGALRFLLGDQLTRGVTALDGLDPARDVVLMVEVREEGTYVPHHKQKIALILAAMRHFAKALRLRGSGSITSRWTTPPIPARSMANCAAPSHATGPRR